LQVGEECVGDIFGRSLEDITHKFLGKKLNIIEKFLGCNKKICFSGNNLLEKIGRQ